MKIWRKLSVEIYCIPHIDGSSLPSSQSFSPSQVNDHGKHSPPVQENWSFEQLLPAVKGYTFNNILNKKRLHVVLIIVLLTTSGLVRSVLAALSGVTKVVHGKAFARGTSKLTWNAYTVFLIRAVFTVIVTIANQIFAYTLSIGALKSLMVFTSETYKICNCWWVRDVGANSQEINILTKRCRSSRVVMGSVGTV